MADDNQIVIPQEGIEIPSYDNNEYLAPEKARKEVATRDALLPYMKDPEVLQQKLEEADDKNAEVLIQEGADAFINTTNKLDSELIAEVSVVDPEQGLLLAEGIQQDGEKMLSQSNDYLSAKNNIMSVEGSENLSKEAIENFASDQILRYGLAATLDKMSLVDKVMSIGGMLLVPDVAWNTSETISRIKDEFNIEEVTGDYFNTVQDIVALGAYRRQLPEEDRLRLDKRLSEIYDEVDDNPIQKAEFFQALLGRNDWFEVEDLAEKSAIAVTIAQLGPAIFMKAFKVANTTKKLGEIGDKEGAMEVADKVTASEDLSKAAGISQIDSANVGHPGAKNVFDGAPSDVSAEYRYYEKNIDNALARIDNTTTLNVADMSIREQKRLAASIRKNLPKDMQLDNLTVSVSKGHPTINFDLVDDAGNVVEKVSRSYRLDDLGGFVDTNTGLGSDIQILRPVTSPKFVQGQDAKRIVDQAMVGTYAKAKIGADYTKAAEMTFRPIKGNKESIARVNDMMIALDGEDVKVTYSLLTKQGWGGIHLNDKEAMAVMGMRKVFDDMHIRNDRTLRQEMNLQGMRSIDDGGEQVFAKPYDTPESAEAAFHNDPDSISIMKDGVEFRDVSIESLEDAYKEGYTLVKSHSDTFDDWFRTGKGENAEYYRFALVKRENVGELPPRVLEKTPNYVPKLNKDANFFVKETRMVKVGGRQVPKPITLAYAPTRLAAEKWMKGAEKMDVDNGVTRTMNIHEDSMDLTLETGDIVKTTGGLIRGKRSQEGLEYAGDFGGGRADVFESIQRAIGVTSDRMAMSRWRMAAREEWMNSARAHIPDISSDWMEARAKVSSAPMSSSQRTKLMNAHDQISGMSMIPTHGEQRAREFFINAAKKLDGIDNLPSQKISAYMYGIKDKNPIDLMKTATFNLTLGTFSMVQIPVQLAGALVAVSIDPVSSVKAANRWLVASALDLGTDLKVIDDTASILGKRMGMNKEDVKSLKNDYSFWRASGMREAVVRGNADTASMLNGLPIDAGLLRRGFHSFVQAGQTPYRMGELANMRISFFTALEREKVLKGKGFVYDEATMQTVLTRAESYRLNMNAANKAAMQKGFWSLPTQFKQIYTKYIEAVAGREFTKQEKFQMLTAQAVAFGGAGVPVVNHYMNQMLDWSGLSEVLNAEELSMAQRGAVGWLLNDYLDVDAAFSGRLTVSADILEELRRMTVDEHTPMLEVALGASAAPLRNGIGFLNNLFMAGNMVYDAETMDLATLSSAAEIAAEGLARLPSSGRKLIAARDLHYGWVRNSDGIPIARVRPEVWDIVARASGLGSQEIEDMYKQDFVNMKIEDTRNATVKQITSAWFTLAHALQEDDKKVANNAQIALSMLNQQLEILPVDEALRIREKVLDRITNPNDKLGKVIDKSITTFYEDSINAGKVSMPKIRKIMEEREASGTRILQEENQ